MLKFLSLIQRSLKKSFDNIRNEQLKYNLLQAIPFWIGSVITGFIAVIYAKFLHGVKIFFISFSTGIHG
jgi:hypothetical protein